MVKHLLAFFIIASLVGSCVPGTATPTLSLTATVLPMITPSPAPSVMPTITPYPTLQTQGPYLLFTRDNKNLTIMNADGSGRKQIQLPNDGYITQLNKAVSPDGKWLAYFTGSVKEPYDITLNLLNLSEETTQQISKLLASGFPANLEPILETMVLGDPPHYDENCFENIECRRTLVERELANSLFSFDWSADSQSVAFIAQIDNPSSDIYLYNIRKNAIRQLTNEMQNIYWLDWAPNGTRILYEISSTPGLGYEGRTLHITDLGGKTTFVNADSLYNQRWGEYDWLTENLYLFHHPNDTDKPPIYDLMIVDTDTGQFKEVWPYSLETFAINENNNTIVLIHKNHKTQLPTVPEGIYIVYPSGTYQKISDVGIQLLLRQGQNPYSILSQDYNGQIYSIDNDGSIDLLPWATDRIPWISPDGKMLFFEENSKLALYTASYQPIQTWSIEATGITWRPDSQGVFILADRDLYYLSIPRGNPVLVNSDPKENCTVQYCYTQYTWLP